MNITISLSSQKLIKKYWMTCGLSHHECSLITSSVDLDTLIFWLSEEPVKQKRARKEQQKIEFILAMLRAELLHDLVSSMQGGIVKINERKKENSKTSKIKFGLLTLSGILLAACQGFDGIATVLNVFALSSTMILGAGLLFSLFSAIVFCGFDLVKVSNRLEIKLSDAHKLLDIYLLQLENIKIIRKKINEYCLAELSQNDLHRLEMILVMLQNRFASLVEASKQFDSALSNKNIQTAKIAISGVAALIFFGSGFFAGQSVALFIANIIVNSVIPTFWPVLAFSILVGLASLSLYWYVERPGLNKLVSSWFGLNEEKVSTLCDKPALAKEASKLANLKEKVISTTRLTSKLAQLKQEHCVNEKRAHQQSLSDMQVSANFYTFLKPPDTLQLSSSKQQNANTNFYI